VRAVDRRQRLDALAGEPVQLERLLVRQLRQLADMAVRRDEQVPRGVRVLVQEHDRGLAPADDEGRIVVALDRVADEAAGQLVRLLDVLQPPRRPDRSRHRVQP
jgi:hypothetical protein